MAKQKKTKGKKKSIDKSIALQKLLIINAILTLIGKLIELIDKLTD